MHIVPAKTSGVLKGGASGANRCYVLAQCAMPPSARVANNVLESKSILRLHIKFSLEKLMESQI